MRRNRRAAVTAAIMTLLLLSNCGSWNIFRRNSADEWVTMSTSWDAVGSRYKTAVADIEKMRAQDQVSNEQWARLVAGEATVRAAGIKLESDMNAWVAHGMLRSFKPKGTNDDYAVCVGAENAVIALDIEIKVSSTTPKLF